MEHNKKSNLLEKGTLTPKRIFLQIITAPSNSLPFFEKQFLEESFDRQIQNILETGIFEYVYFRHLNKNAFSTMVIIENWKSAQVQWVAENHPDYHIQDNWREEIVRLQIESIRPSIVMFCNSSLLNNNYLNQLKYRPKLVMGMITSHDFSKIDLSGCDILLSNVSKKLPNFQKWGASCVKYFEIGFPNWLNQYASPSVLKGTDLVLCDDWHALNHERKQLIHFLAQDAIIKKKFSLSLFLSGNKNDMPYEIQCCLQGDRYSLKRLDALRKAKICICFGLQTEIGTIGLFEATGVGCCILTENHPNMSHYFQKGIEIETFQVYQELFTKICDFLENDKKRIQVAKAGQNKCLRYYSMNHSNLMLAHLIHRKLIKNNRKKMYKKTHTQLTCCILTTYYNKYTQNFFHNHPCLKHQAYNSQLSAILADCFGDSDFYSNGLRSQGWHAVDLITNCEQLQKQWAIDNHYSSQNIYEIGIAQIKKMQPDVVYLHDLNIWGRGELLDAIRDYAQLIVGQTAYPLDNRIDLHGFDIIFSSFPHYIERFRKKGITAYYQPLAFDKRVLHKIRNPARTYPITFIGGISQHHKNGIFTLEKIAEKVGIDIWGYGANVLPNDSILKKNHHGEAWGLEMFTLMAQSQMTLNRHIDVAENFANNMRLFEATGCGALLITDYKDNLNELFEVGKEVVAYRSPEECVDLIDYYMKHPMEARRIAEAGQRRTLRDHSYLQRMIETSGILKKHLNK